MQPEPPVGAATGVTRRALVGLGVSGFGAAAVAFFWPERPRSSRGSGSFGETIDAGDFEHIRSEIRSARQPVYVGEGRFYLVEHEDESVAALHQKCTHLGCRVPFCSTSQWFECACHASMFDGTGAVRGGPAPRGLDRFRVEVREGRILVDTSEVIVGAPHGTVSSGQEPDGPHCVGP